MTDADYMAAGINPDDRSHGYECFRCGYEPTQRELDKGSCPRCAEVCRIKSAVKRNKL